MIRILTDSSADILPAEAARLGVEVVPLTVTFEDGTVLRDGIDQTPDEFYAKLAACDKLPTTSQPSPDAFLPFFEQAKAAGDTTIAILISGALSGTLQSARIAAQTAEYEDIHLIDSRNATLGLRLLVELALKLRDEGHSAPHIVEVLEKTKSRVRLLAIVDTLKYLKKGGRITPAAAAIGTVLNLKPVLQIQGEKLDAFAKVRGWKAAKKTMLNAIEKDLNERFADVKNDMVLGMAYTCSKEEAQEWKQEIVDRFPGYEIVEGPLSLSVACHIGPGAMAVTCMKQV